MKPNPFIPVNSSDTSSVISTSNLPPKSPAQARTTKTGNLPTLSNRKTTIESDEDSSSSSPRESSASSSHTNPRSSRQAEKKTVIDLNQLDAIYRNGKAEDQFKYGQMYEEGNGVDRDYAKALNWYSQRLSIRITQKRLTVITKLPLKIIQKRSSSLARCTPMD